MNPNPEHAINTLSNILNVKEETVRESISKNDLNALSETLLLREHGFVQKTARLLTSALLRHMPTTIRLKITDMIKALRNPNRTLAVSMPLELNGNRAINELKKKHEVQYFYGDNNGVICISHDVDNRLGYENVRKTAEIDNNYGIKTTFNFLTHDNYRPEKKLLDDLRDSGFEVGLHGFTHDIAFAYRKYGIILERIKRSLDSLGFVPHGFRSPALSLSEKLFDALEEAGIKYDSSMQANCSFYSSAGLNFPYVYPGRKLVEIPLGIQDDVFFRDARASDTEALKVFSDIFKEISAFGGVIVVNMHPHLMADRYDFYADFLKLAVQFRDNNGMKILTTEEVYQAFTKSQT